MYDIIISTQAASFAAYACMYGAHLVSVQTNEHWNFAIYVLLAIGVVFMLFPYLVTDDRDVKALEDENKRQQEEIKELIEECSELYSDNAELAKENGQYS